LAVGFACGLAADAADRPSLLPAAQRAVEQFREFYLGSDDAFAMRDNNEPAPDPSRSRRFAQSLRADGTWADIDYASQAHSAWPPATHGTRMTAMVATAGERATSPADRAELLVAAHRAFAFWIAHDFQCPNWWYNEIGVPKVIGTAALLLGDELAPAEYRYATGTSLSRFPIGRTGQNKVWLAGNTLMLGLLTGDLAVIRAASDAIWGEVHVTTAEGIQADFSFHQHGAQQQFGNYGMALAVETARWGRILRDTPWALPEAQLAVFRRYLLDGQNWVSWRGAMDISACGRQVMPHSPREKTANLARVMAQAASFDAAHEDAYRAFIARNRPGAANELTGNRFFWRSDYMVYRRPDFAATLKLSSKRVIGAELVNRENLSGYHTADGALYLYREGGEYEDIFPVWDWRKLPGVTCAQTALPAFKVSFVNRDFVGGVSDGVDGCCALDYVRDGLRAKKAWFFGGDTVVCLGADIAGQAPATVATTLNQCLLRGTVRVAGETQALAPGSHTLTGIPSVEHDGWRYTLLEAGVLHLETGPVTGNWHRVFDNPDSPQADVTKKIFTLWLDHGRNPQAAHYAYAVAPASTVAPIRVLENSATKQAVLLPDTNVGIVFWSASDLILPDGRRIASDEPCLLLVEAKTILVVDPTQKLKSLHLQVGGSEREVTLPTGARAGTAGVLP
jgi:chondroitin AC lyase